MDECSFSVFIFVLLDKYHYDGFIYYLHRHYQTNGFSSLNALVTLVKGKRVTGFTNGEEAAVGLTYVVPFLIEDILKQNGAIYEKGDDWSSFAISDGLLISGQNPQSSLLVAQKLVEQIQKK